MEILGQFIGLFLHIDIYLADFVKAYGVWVYGILFLIVFAETGFVITPFLPGDSLLFASGAIAATGDLNPNIVVLFLAGAAIIGDTINYCIGNYLGPKVFNKQKSVFFNPRHLERAHLFYEKYGGKTIVIARFVPIIRTFAPFVAGIGSMSYPRFIVYNVTGGILWVVLFVYAGYFFSNLPIVKENFSLVIMAIIIISVIPVFIKFFKHEKEKQYFS